MSEDGYYKIRRKELIEARGIDLDKIFRGHPDKWKNVICTFRNDLYHIIQTVDAKSTIKCTFSFVNGVFVEKSKRLTELMQALPIRKSFRVISPDISNTQLDSSLSSIYSSRVRGLSEEMAIESQRFSFQFVPTDHSRFVVFRVSTIFAVDCTTSKWQFANRVWR